MKRLTLVRHAKSSWKDPSLADFDRPLNKRGKRDAPEMGRRLGERGRAPELIITSPARRARRTARALAAALDFPAEDVLEEEDIYEAGPGTLLDLIRGLDEGADDVLLVGHNPGFTNVADLLAGAGIANIPTAGIVEIEFPLSHWSDITPGSGTVVHYDFPKNPPAS